MKILKFLPLAVAASLTFISCEKLREETGESTESGTSEARMTSISELAEDDVDQVSTTFSEEQYAQRACTPCSDYVRLPECASVTSTADFPKTITIDYGNGCETNRGVIKSGKIIIELSDRWRNEGATRTVTFENFTINGNPVTGSSRAVNTGQNEQREWVIEIERTWSMEMNEGNASRTSSMVRTWMAGFGTSGCEDDRIELTGQSEGRDHLGNSYRTTVRSPLLIDRTCRYIQSGVIEITRDRERTGGSRTFNLDFGEESCDDSATLTINEHEYDIDLDEYGCRLRRDRC